MTLNDLFDSFRHSAFRYEGQPAYDVPDEVERIQAWREHRPRPERSVRTNDWLRRIAVTTAQDKEWSRVRAVDWPLPEYLRYELNGYVENQAAGDRTLLLDRDQALPREHADFWLFDGGTEHAQAGVMRYDGAGRFLGVDMVEEASHLLLLEGERQRMIAAATPLNHWLAALDSRVA